MASPTSAGARGPISSRQSISSAWERRRGLVLGDELHSNAVMAQTVLELQPSETAVLHAASRIYAAYVVRGAITPGAEPQFMQKAIQEAIQLAHWTDQAVQSDDEKRQRDAF